MLGRYVATELCAFLVATKRPKCVRARSLRSDRALCVLGRYVATEPCRYLASEGLTGRYVASGSKPRRVLLVFVVKSQRKLRLRRNKKCFDEDSNKNGKEDLSEA
ncbi:hypothetical protein DY000_02021178 [Brassica cretica]|uniref:Secreted protein n=1 Tax=Brassica cretica TaxID=69181 RepID=A0ABQ7E7F1_BRACR|nr:hypothetical protein DY000_02021178 [Brassica cretica]